MRRSWPFIVAVAAVGALAGAAIAGKPSTVDPMIIDPAQVTTTTIATLATSADGEGASAATTTLADVSSLAPVPPTTVASAVTTSTEAATTTTGTSAANTSTTTSATSDTSDDGSADGTDARLVVANADGRFGLARRITDLLDGLGYTDITPTDTTARLGATVIYYRDGFDDTAQRLAGEIGAPNAIVAPLPDAPTTGIDDQGDIIILLGGDIA